MDRLVDGLITGLAGDLAKSVSVNVQSLLILGLAALLILGGCANTNSRYQYKDGYHIVKSGETLYEISEHYGINYKTVARWNGIRYPYRIYPGQKIRLNPGKYTRSTTGPSKSASSTSTRKTNPAATSNSNPKPVASSVDWQWPVQGKLLTRFSNSDTGSKGIDIVATEGSTIRAAAGGKVVYSGSGLRGYGNLVIIKHNETYLSAYAHNRRLLVAEGVQVKAGQKIAELGSSGTDRPKLHFEIRKNGQPVDPIRYLPQR